MNSFAEWLQAELNKRDWSQSDLARKTGLTRSAVSYILSLKSKVPDNKSLVLIADALEVSFEEVLVAAGLMKKSLEITPFTTRIIALIEKLPQDERERFTNLQSFG